MLKSRYANTPEPPYYSVIFASQRMPKDNGYNEMADLLDQLAEKQPGYLGAEFARDASGFGITVSYWKDLESIAKWKAETSHRQAQRLGKSDWYEGFEIRIAKVERAYNFRAAESDGSLDAS
jgi:heme-degrading monooxygenase HmoA